MPAASQPCPESPQCPHRSASQSRPGTRKDTLISVHQSQFTKFVVINAFREVIGWCPGMRMLIAFILVPDSLWVNCWQPKTSLNHRGGVAVRGKVTSNGEPGKLVCLYTFAVQACHSLRSRKFLLQGCHNCAREARKQQLFKPLHRTLRRRPVRILVPKLYSVVLKTQCKSIRTQEQGN